MKAACSTCKAICSVTYKYKPYETEHGDFIPDVLQGFCDSCGERLLLPPQSSYKIAPFYNKASIVEEFRIPNEVEDALLSMSSYLRIEKPELFKIMLRLYLRKNWVESMEKTHQPKLGVSKARLSVRVDEQMEKLLAMRSKKVSLTKNKFVTWMIWDAKERLVGGSKESKEFLKATELLRTPTEELEFA